MRASAGGTYVAGIISPFLPKGDLGGAPQSPSQWGRGACGFRWRHPLCYWVYELDTERVGLARHEGWEVVSHQ